jgi:hypothetical protein
MLKRADFDFRVPERLIPLSPPELRGERREHARMAVLHRAGRRIEHSRFDRLRRVPARVRRGRGADAAHRPRGVAALPAHRGGGGRGSTRRPGIVSRYLFLNVSKSCA